MELLELLEEEKIEQLPKKNTIGIDIGSRQSKAVLIADGKLYTALIPTGFFMKQTAEELLEILFDQSNLTIHDIDYIVSTGYGRIALDFEEVSNRVVTEISCHGLGAYYLGKGIKTIIDIGGQDSKVIRIDPTNGKVVDFVMNDKCAAGTGRFLEKTANILGFDVTEIGDISLDAKNASDISSQCVVFAESEIISGRSKGENVKDLAAGIHNSVARRINNLLNRVGIEENVLFTGGVSNNVGMKVALENVLGFEVETSKLDTVYAGALGAAVYAAQYALANEKKEKEEEITFQLDLTDLDNAIAWRKEQITKKETGQKKNVGYLCAYTPLEILGAADVSHIRLLHTGSPKEVIAGEVITQSIFCDFTKSCIGSFSEENPLYTSLDKIYTFYTCDCMKKTAEAINDQFVSTSIYNLPRLMHNESSRKYFLTELQAFVKNLEELTKSEIKEDEIRKNINLYNKAKKYLRTISGFRKVKNPLLTSTEFQKIALSYYYLPIQELLPYLEKIIRELENASANINLSNKNVNQKAIRLMIAGGIIAEGDNKLIHIIEEEIGAKIVVEDNCSGYSPFAIDIKETNQSALEDIAEGYLLKAPCARMKPLEERIEFSGNLAKEYEVDGIIFYYLKFCPCYGITKNEFIHKYQELGIPVLEISSDYSKGDEGQLKTRLEAFIEVLGERS